MNAGNRRQDGDLYPRRWLAAAAMIGAATMDLIDSGSFTTAQQLGGGLGVAIVGAVFFVLARAPSFTASFEHAIPIVIALFAASAADKPRKRTTGA